LVAFSAGAAIFAVGHSVLDRPQWVYYYWVVDDHTLLVGTNNGPGVPTCA